MMVSHCLVAPTVRQVPEQHSLSAVHEKPGFPQLPPSGKKQRPFH